MGKIRLTELLLARDLAEDEKEARALIMSGRVNVNGVVIDKPGTGVSSDALVEVRRAAKRYASRGGEKLAAALDTFPVTVAGRVCIDVGASTGGFTDCLLERGAASVYAVDVGRGLLAWELRNDDRVVVMEGVNARYLDGGTLEPQPTLLVADVSFISLEKAVGRLLRTSAYLEDVILLIKPQYEAPAAKVEPGGVVTRPEVVRDVVADIIAFVSEIGFGPRGLIESPLQGPAGNREFLLWAARGSYGGILKGLSPFPGPG